MSPTDAELDELYVLAYRIALRVLGDRGDAEDCAQEATARAMARWRKVAAYREPWVVRVSTNLALGQLRRRPFVGLEALTPAVVGAGEDQIADGVDLRRALLALPRRQREVVTLRYLADFSEREIATSLGCSSGTVKTHTKRGLAALRRGLTPRENP